MTFGGHNEFWCMMVVASVDHSKLSDFLFELVISGGWMVQFDVNLELTARCHHIPDC